MRNRLSSSILGNAGTEKQGSARRGWLNYTFSTLSMSLILTFSIGVVIGTVRGWSYLTNGFYVAFLRLVIHNLNTSFLIFLILLTVALAVFGGVRLLNLGPKQASFIAVGFCCLPFFLLWGYLINKDYLPKFFALSSIFWNMVTGLSFIALWVLLSTGFFLWARSRFLNNLKVRFKTVVSLISLLVCANLLAFLAPVLSSPPNAPNVIILLIDALRGDHLSCYGYSRNTTPSIDEFSKDAVIFTQAVSQSTFTKTSVSSIFTSLYPYQHGVYWGQRIHGKGQRIAHILSEEETTLAEALLSNGFLTMAFAKNIHLDAMFGFGQGFVEYNDRGGLFKQHTADINRYFIKWCRRLGRYNRFFAYIHYMDMHDPYRPKPPYSKMYGVYSDIYANVDFSEWGAYVKDIREGRQTLTRNDIEQLKAYYDGQLNYVDSQIGFALEQLKKLGLYDNSLIILTADHGDGFMEHGFISHSTTPYDELLHVPLIIKFPNSRYRQTVSEQVRLIDIMPTILDYVGVPAAGNVQGFSLLNYLDGKKATETDSGFPQYAYSEISEEDAYPTIAVRTEKYKYIHFQKKPDELYDITADPLEKDNIIEVRRNEAKEFRKMALDIVAQRRQKDLDTRELSDKAIKALKALGYVE